ncbi:hypothetical protein Tco_1528344, partial [Tanacetum coccineum]
GRSDVERLKYEVGCGEEEREKDLSKLGLLGMLAGKFIGERLGEELPRFCV